MRGKPKRKPTASGTQNKFPILISYAYLRKMPEAAIDWWVSQQDIYLLLDSGAFTAWSSGKPIVVADYIAFLKDWGHRFSAGYMALDVVKEPKPTRKNLYQMLEAGLKPIPVHVFGEDEAWLNELYTYNDWVALVVRQQMGDPESFIDRVLRLKMQWAAGRKVHWFGYIKQQQIQKWKPYSCDGSAWASCFLFGVLKCYLGGGKWVSFTRKSLIGKPIPRLLKAVLFDVGIPLSDIYQPNRWKRGRKNGYKHDSIIPFVGTCASWVRYVQDIQVRFKTQLFLAMMPAKRFDNELVFRFWSGIEGRYFPIRGFSHVPEQRGRTRVGRDGFRRAPSLLDSTKD